MPTVGKALATLLTQYVLRHTGQETSTVLPTSPRFSSAKHQIQGNVVMKLFFFSDVKI